jgi:nicotinic acid phosphoribosyltransferase
MVEQSLLLTDMYQLSMLEACTARDMAGTAVFVLFVRKLPPGRGFLVAAGLEQAVAFLETMRFTAEELAWLRDSRLDPRIWRLAEAGPGGIAAMTDATRSGPLCTGYPLRLAAQSGSEAVR